MDNQGINIQKEKADSQKSIRFTQLQIKLRLTEECRLPEYKVSAIRGGMGQMLLAQHCIRDGECEHCDFCGTCITHNIMYTPFQIKPPSVTARESMGYVIDCTDNRKHYRAGEGLYVGITLFGQAVSYVTPVIYALASLGNVGIGRERAKFRLEEITNRHRQSVLEDGNIFLQNLRIETIDQYVSERIAGQDLCGDACKITLLSPCSAKYQGKTVERFDSHALVMTLQQKYYHYQLYEGIEAEKEYWEEQEFPVVRKQHMEKVAVPRYSSTQNQKMSLRGIQGELVLERCNDKFQKLAYAAEILHLGKNTRLGFGKIRVQRV